jgi:hypothetical protein
MHEAVEFPHPPFVVAATNKRCDSHGSPFTRLRA